MTAESHARARASRVLCRYTPQSKPERARLMFVYIHSYMDGNGRMGRFLMNVMLAGGGYRWTVIPVKRRAEYMGALEAASAGSDIEPFTGFLAGLVRANG